MQVRQDEGAPKYLNAWSPARSQFGGGIGYLTDGTETLSTFYPGGATSFERIFGVGYFRKKVSGERYSIDQAIIAPFGDDPVLLSQVTIANLAQPGSPPANLRWIEYWGCHVYQFSFRSYIEQIGGGGTPWICAASSAIGLRISSARCDGSAGLLEEQAVRSAAIPKKRNCFARMKTSLATHANPFLAPIAEPAPEASFDDLHPPGTFLVSFDAPADAFTTDAKSFFGAGGVGGDRRPGGHARR